MAIIDALWSRPLILSNGNASVESAFSINKDVLIENLSVKSLITLRTVYDAIKAYGDIENIEITKKEKKSNDLCENGKNKHYHNYFDEQKIKRKKMTINLISTSLNPK